MLSLRSILRAARMHLGNVVETLLATSLEF